MDASQDSNTSPSKGKGIDNNSKNWRAGWWDFYPLLERPKRPVQWSQSSVIFTAHPTQPTITGRHFSSSRKFVLSSPPPVVNSPASYDPPTVISVSPGDEWLFAYFPRRDGEGTGCLWKRGAQIDNWIARECWSLPKGAGIVAASWLGNRREWVAGALGIPIRLPIRGPSIPISDATLLLVTQDNHIHLSYIRHYSSGLKTIKRSLIFPGISTESSPNSMDVGENANNTRQCLDAAIGMGYNGKANSVFIATHSRRVPPPAPTALNAPTFDSMDLSVPGDLTSLDQKTVEWENWGEERTTELYELQIRFDGVQLGAGVFQLSTLDCPPLSLSGLTFICTPPRPNPLQPPAPDSTMSPQLKVNPPDKGKIGLVTTYVNFHNYTKPPTSTLTLYSLSVRAANNNNRIWTVHQTSTRSIDTGIVTHVESFIDFSGPSTVLMHACVLDTSGSFISMDKDRSIGALKVLNIPNLTDNTNWGSTAIKSSTGALGRDLPLFASLSPNRRLFCTLSSSLWQNQTAVYTLPLPVVPDVSSARLPLALATAILGRMSTADLIHVICSPTVSVADAASILYQTLEILDKHYKSDMSPNVSTWDMLGMATEVYRTKALLTKNDIEAEALKNRWETAHDTCLLAACNVAFEDCKEGDTYDLEAVWPIIGMCRWVITFTENLMKASVLSSDAPIVVRESFQSDNSDSETLALPSLLHLCHPFNLQNVFSALGHVKAFRSFLGSLPAGSEHSQVAKAVLVDAVDSSGVDLGNLISLLEEHLEPLRKMDSQECRKALAACHPTPMMRPELGKLLKKISESETLLNKSTLFIKPSDLIDGVARLSLGSQPKTQENDVISKCLLLKLDPKDICLRCGGKTVMDRDVALPRGHFHSKWHLFELKWQLRCICGGPWSLPPVN